MYIKNKNFRQVQIGNIRKIQNRFNNLVNKYSSIRKMINLLNKMVKRYVQSRKHYKAAERMRNLYILTQNGLPDTLRYKKNWEEKIHTMPFMK